MLAINQGDGRGMSIYPLTLFDLLSGGVAVMNPEGVIFLANEPWLAFFQEHGRAEGLVSADYLAAREQAGAAGDILARQEWEGIQGVLQGRSGHFQMDFSLPAKAAVEPRSNETLAWFSLRVSPLAAPAAGVLLQLEDITRFRPRECPECHHLETALQAAQQALRHSEARWLTFLRANPVGISITLAENGRFVEVNQTLVTMFGHSREAMLGRTSLELGIWSDPPDRERLVETLMQQGRVQGFKAPFRRQSGEQGVMQIAAELIFLDGQPHVLGISTDITAVERQNEELRRAKEAADAANRAKSAFLANMSHDIRTPMNAILGYAQLMQRDQALSPGAREKLDIIRQSGQHLLALIEDVLEMSKIEAGRVKVQSNAFNLGGLLNDLAVMYRLRTRAKNLEFKLVQTGPLPAQVVADEVKLRQILLNLLGNSVKFTEKGFVELRTTLTHDQDQSWLSIKVADTGLGISAEGLAKLFHQFEQTSIERASNQGSGLGLTISREYARLMGGDITVESELGQGSIFHLMIPVGVGGTLVPAKQTPARRVLGFQPDQAPIKVLVADDNANNRNWLKQLLMVIGCEVLEAENGREAIQVWEKWRPQLVLMDLQMPVVDGLEATRRIKATPAGKNTVVLALTAIVQEESQRAILLAGAADLLGKPMEEGALFEKMEAHLGARFVYESPSLPAATASEQVSLNLHLENLAKLPAGLRTALHDAIANGDLAGFEKRLVELGAVDPVLVRLLRPLAEAYDYDELLRLLT